MTDAINHLAAYNRIAYALENMPPDDQTALLTALDAIANKTIPVADMTGIVTAINNKQIPSTDLTGVVTAINNISIPSGTGGGSGSLDCECLAEVLAPLIDKVDQLICVIAPIAASNIQLAKIIAYIGMDGPNMGIDAPPGTFIFPTPGDTSPPITYTPTPTPTPTDSTGGWITPPIIEGVYYTDPPGGMQGATDLAAYEDYKCNVANFIFDYLLAWMDWLDKKGDSITVDMMINDGVIWLIGAIRWLMAARGLMAVMSATGGVSLVKAGTAVTAVIMESATVIILTGTLFALAVELFFTKRTISDWITVLNAAKQDVICALWKAKTPSAAREGVMTAITNHYTLYYSFLPDIFKEGTMGRLTRYILEDNLLANLFACQEGWPVENFGTGSTPCTRCMLCKDMDEAIVVNQRSILGYPAELPAIEIRTGLTTYPITIDLGTIDSEVLCMVGRAEWINGGPIVNITQNGADLTNWGWDGWTDTGAGNASALESMPFKENLFYPKAPATRFTGHIVLKIYNEGATWKTRYEISTVSWRLPA